VLINLKGSIVGLRDPKGASNVFIPSDIIQTYATP
jgi:hypothetical protein